MGYTARLFNPESDKEGLLQLWNEGLRSPSKERYEAMYAPCGVRHIITWLLFYDKQSNPVGCLSLIPRKFNISGQDIMCGINCDIIVTKRHRTLGPAVILLESLIKECQNYGFEALMAMPNNMSRPIFTRVGYKQFGAVCRWSKILLTEGKLKARIKNAFLRKVAAGLADFFLRWLMGGFAELACGCMGKNLKAVNAAFNQSAIDFMKMDARGEEHDFAYLQWRFGKLRSNESQLYSLYDGDTLFGFVVYFHQGREAIVEYMYVYSEKNVNTLFACFIGKMRKLRMETISIPYFSAGRLRKNFRQMGFLRRDRRQVFLRAINKSLDETFSLLLKDWSLFETDLDL